ncbi:MAG: anaerobic ribonucleoside-triphosphate reductase [Actinobacteria bacterium]|nr:anaerobic ribonucleoside-triphosphate reductase [Actinomycetota bacterium]
MSAASNIRVLKRRERAEDATDIALLVSTSSKEEINLWDKSKIVNSLVLETDASQDLAQEIADRVEERIIQGRLNTVTTSIIRELVDLELLERGLGTMHKRHSHVGLPMYDVEQIITSANKENSNTTHNPESINLTLAEAILKEFALRNVFSDDIASAHMVGDIHLHDLGFIIRPYSYLGDTVVHWRVKGSHIVFTTTMEQLYHLLPDETRPEPTVRVKYPAEMEMLDRGGNWTDIKRVVKKDRLGKEMIFLATSDGKFCVVTHDHPVITAEEIKPASLVSEGEELETLEVEEGKMRGLEEVNITHLLEANASSFKLRFNAEDVFVAHQRLQELVSQAAQASSGARMRRSRERRKWGSSPSARRVKVVMAEPVDVLDVYIYDVTTDSGTLIANGIYSHNCGGHSLDYIKKYGISLPNITSTSRPAKHPEVLIGHMVKMASTLQSHYAGAIGWEAVNMFFAPYMVGLDRARIGQLAQMLIYEFNQLAGARGSQVVFTDFNLYWNIPRHFRDAPAIGPGGVYTGKTYKDYEKEAQDFLTALFEVYLEGDAMGKTFVFPKPLLHINEDFFRTDGHEEFLDLACKVASRQGITYFVFDRGDEITVSQCCRLKLKLNEKDLQEVMTPEKMRFTALQNITINLPRIAYKANGSDEVLLHELEKAMQMVAKAHLQKKEFIASLMAQGVGGPLSVLCDAKDGEKYLRMDRLTYLVGLLGLNEMVQYHTSRELHESPEALKFGLKVVANMNLLCKKLSQQYGINLVLEESPAESSGYRLAKLDMKYYPSQAMEVLKGSDERDEFYYTNSVHLNVEADIDYIERVQKQSLFHPLIEAGAICHVWLGEHEPDPESIKNFVIKTFRNTQSSQIAFSPEFTVCEDCRTTSRGLHEECPNCGSSNVYGITRIVGYFSKVTTWNKGKVGELKGRVRTGLKGGFERAASEGIREAGLSKVSSC